MRSLKSKARLVINTTGPWSDKVRNLSNNGKQHSQMRPTKGVHLVVDSSKIKVSQPVYFDTGLGDGRMVFVCHGRTKPTLERLIQTTLVT